MLRQANPAARYRRDCEADAGNGGREQSTASMPDSAGSYRAHSRMRERSGWGHFELILPAAEEYKGGMEKVNPSPPTFMGDRYRRNANARLLEMKIESNVCQCNP